MTKITHLLLQVPELNNYEDIGLKSFLIFVIICMGFVIWHLWNRINKLSDKIQELQVAFQRQIMDAHEKTLTLIPSIEKSVLDSNINITDKIMHKMDEQHKATRADIKETIKEQR